MNPARRGGRVVDVAPAVPEAPVEQLVRRQLHASMNRPSPGRHCSLLTAVRDNKFSLRFIGRDDRFKRQSPGRSRIDVQIAGCGQNAGAERIIGGVQDAL